MARAIPATPRVPHRRNRRWTLHWPASKRELVASAKDWWTCIDRTNTVGLAAQVAFWMFLALLPLAAVIGYVVARLAMTNASVQVSVLRSLPAAGRQLVTGELSRVANWNGGAIGPVALVVFVWLAAGGVQSVFDALELQAGSARAWWRKKLLAIAACVAISIGAAAIALLTTGASSLFHLVGHAVPAALDFDLGPLWKVVRVVAGLAVAVGVVYAVFWIGIPSRAHDRAPIFPGAVFAVAFDAACVWGYGAYLGAFGIGEGYEAGLAAIGVTLTSLYLLSLGVLVGASLNQHLGGRTCGTPESP